MSGDKLNDRKCIERKPVSHVAPFVGPDERRPHRNKYDTTDQSEENEVALCHCKGCSQSHDRSQAEANFIGGSRLEGREQRKDRQSRNRSAQRHSDDMTRRKRLASQIQRIGRKQDEKWIIRPLI